MAKEGGEKMQECSLKVQGKRGAKLKRVVDQSKPADSFRKTKIKTDCWL